MCSPSWGIGVFLMSLSTLWGPWGGLQHRTDEVTASRALREDLHVYFAPDRAGLLADILQTRAGFVQTKA